MIVYFLVDSSTSFVAFFCTSSYIMRIVLLK